MVCCEVFKDRLGWGRYKIKSLVCRLCSLLWYKNSVDDFKLPKWHHWKAGWEECIQWALKPAASSTPLSAKEIMKSRCKLHVSQKSWPYANGTELIYLRALWRLSQRPRVSNSFRWWSKIHERVGNTFSFSLLLCIRDCDGILKRKENRKFLKFWNHLLEVQE